MSATTAPTAPTPAYDPGRLLARVRRDLVGLAREAEVLAVALAAGRHVVLEGPPGTGKSTLLRALADEAGVPLLFVEGNAELTPGRLVGYHDPALVLAGGYRPEAFVPGPLAEAVQGGGLLYLEELNRIPEESLNVLITALAEGELHVPRVGRIPADPRFRLIAAMNPYDAVGTARIGQAVYDRMCRIAIGYQDEAHEREIVARVTGTGTGSGTGTDDPVLRLAVAVTRATRTHPDIRVGASVRGAIDTTLLARGLDALRAPHGEDALARRAVLLDAALAALSGRIRVDEASDRLPEDIIAELLDRVLAEWARDRAGDGDDPGKGERPAGLPQEPGRGRILTGEAAQEAVRDAARRTTSRRELEQRHPGLSEVSPGVGELDSAAVEELLRADPDAAAALLAELANATDRELRAKARRLAARLFVRLARRPGVPRAGVRRLVADTDVFGGDVDLDATLARTDGLRPLAPSDVVSRRWAGSSRAICLLIDRSGSMSGHGLATAAMAAAGVLVAAGERADCSVVVFARDAVVLQQQGRPRPPASVVDDVLSLRGHGVTDLALALRAAGRQLARAEGRELVTLLLSDAVPTAGGDPFTALRGVGRLCVLGTSDEPDAVERGRALARKGGGAYRRCARLADLPAALGALLHE